ncbi:tetratricopeptide repeat protein [Actinosynnema sp. NPDC023658]|uniref:tetratricopeptide repeat protein n=1 Tax=Actinosynnema sp. NPDC023658 TaxID=3155465 RepID=UPI00340CCF30
MLDPAHESVHGVPARPGDPAAAGDSGLSEVADLEAFAGEVRALDQRYGGVPARDAAVGRLPAALALVDASPSGAGGARLRTAVADLHSLAGWVSFDTGMADAAVGYFGTALRLASSVGNTSLTSNVRHQLGRLRLHHNEPTRALAEFRLGALAAEASGSSRAAALIKANTAWSWARLRREQDAVALLSDLDESLAEVHGGPGAEWPAFSTRNDLSALTGIVYTELAQVVDPHYARLGVLLLTSAVQGYGADMARRRAFSLISLAVCHLVDDQVHEGLEAGARAVDLCEQLASHRTAERLRPLRNEAQRRRSHRGARELADRIRAFRPPCCPTTRNVAANSRVACEGSGPA